MSTAIGQRFETVCEVESAGGPPVLEHPGWSREFPWLQQGTTWRGGDGHFDLGLFGATPVGECMARWRDLVGGLGFGGAVHAGQVHGTRVIVHDRTVHGLLIGEGADGHATRASGLLMSVSAADCIPVSIVDPGTRTVAIAHAGWRGVAGGMVESAIATLGTMGCRRADLRVHCGPAICGECYEVGPEVHARLGLPPVETAAPADIRLVAANRARLAGVPAQAITVSAWCTRCSPGNRLFSHRGGDAGRQMGLLGIRPDGGG